MLRSIPLLLVGGVAALALLAHLAGASKPRVPSAPTAGRVPPPEGPAPPPTPAPPVPGVPAQTAHARLVLDGYFAQRIGLLAAFARLPLRGKTIRHRPHEHLVTAFVNILAGHRQLQQISRGPSPLRADPVVAAAWQQTTFPEVSGVCRQLHTTTWETAEAVRTELQAVLAPYVAQCHGRLAAGGEPVVVDWDLTAKPITTDATSDPFAAYGHMSEGVGKGYQWAAATLRSRGPDGQPRPVVLGGFLRPGNAHPPECVARLQALTEASLGRPRRRPELVAGRLAAAEQVVREQQARVDAAQARLAATEQWVQALTERVQAVEQRLAGWAPTQQARRARDERLARRGTQAQAQAVRDRRQAQVVAAQRALATAQQAVTTLAARRDQFLADNAAGPAPGPPPEIVMDAAFGSSALIAELIEAGYEVTTKATSPGPMRRLLAQAAGGEAVFGDWQAVAANAEVAECRETRYARCPYPLRLLGYRKHRAASATRPARTETALVLTTVPAAVRSAVQTMQHYHQRGGTIELVNKQAKSALGFCGQRLRHAPGLDILGQFVFAGLNFIAWSADTVWAESGPEAGACPGLAELVQLAQAPATVVGEAGGVLIECAPESGWPHRRLRLGALRQPPLPGFAWPGVPLRAQCSPPRSQGDLVARKLG